MREERKPLIQVPPDAKAEKERGSQNRSWGQFSLRRLFGFVTVGCVAFGTLITFAPRRGNIPDFIVAILSVILAVETTLAAFAACDPWLGYPSALDECPPVFPGEPFRTDLATRILAFVAGMLFLAIGGLVAVRSSRTPQPSPVSRRSTIRHIRRSPANSSRQKKTSCGTQPMAK